MKSLILDSSVCIDLHHGGLLLVVLQLGYTAMIPDVILSELNDPPGSEFEALGYGSVSLSGEEVAEITFLQRQYPKLSVKDAFALRCSIKTSGTLLAGDHDLRIAATAENVEVHGVLWILDELVKSHLLRARDAKMALEQILANKARLPKYECETRLTTWGKEDLET